MKSQIRKSILDIRRGMTKGEVLLKSKMIFQHITCWNEFINAKSIMLYSPINNEVNTYLIAKEAILKNKKLIYPKSIKETIEIIPCGISRLEELKLGAYGILEPIEDKVIDKNEIDLVFVPGVAFDKFGYRLGYGAGYYDRFLSDFKGIKVGLCYDFQIVDDVFKEQHDSKMDYLICEKGILNI